MIETYENLIEQCFNTGLMRIEMDRKKGKMLEIDYIQAIEKLQNELKKKDLRIDGLKKSSDLMKLEKNNALVKAQAALSKVGSAELMIKQLKDYIALINVNRQQQKRESNLSIFDNTYFFEKSKLSKDIKEMRKELARIQQLKLNTMRELELRQSKTFMDKLKIQGRNLAVKERV